MTLEDINYVAQIVGTIVLIGTFVALLFQIRQTNRLLRNQAKRAQIAEIRSLSDAIYQIPGLAEIMTRAATEGLEALSLVERTQCFAFLMTAQRAWEAMFVQYQDGSIDAGLWQAHVRQARAATNDTGIHRQFWMMRRDFFMPEYRKFYEAEILGHAGSDTLGYGNKAAPTKEEAPQSSATPGGGTP